MRAQHHRIRKATALAALCAAVALFAGCELDDSTDEEVTITPASASLKASETNIVEFIAIGGTPDYTWSMNNSILGTLYVATTNTALALYQSSTNIGTNLITVRDSNNNSANSRIVQK